MTVLVRVCLTCFVLVAAEMTPGDTVLSPSTAHSAEKRLVVLPDASEQLPLGVYSRSTQQNSTEDNTSPDNESPAVWLASYWYVVLVILVLVVVVCIFVCACIAAKIRKTEAFHIRPQRNAPTHSSGHFSRTNNSILCQPTNYHHHQYPLDVESGSPGTLSMELTPIPSPQPSFASQPSIRSLGGGGGGGGGGRGPSRNSNKKRKTHSPGHSSGSEETIRSGREEARSAVSLLSHNSRRSSRLEGERLPPRSSSRGHHSNPSNPTVKVSISGLGQNEPEGVASISSIPSTTSIMSVGSNHSHSDASQPTIVEVKLELPPHHKNNRLVTAAVLAESARQLAESAAEFGEEQEDEFVRSVSRSQLHPRVSAINTTRPMPMYGSSSNSSSSSTTAGTRGMSGHVLPTRNPHSHPYHYHHHSQEDANLSSSPSRGGVATISLDLDCNSPNSDRPAVHTFPIPRDRRFHDYSKNKLPPPPSSLVAHSGRNDPHQYRFAGSTSDYGSWVPPPRSYRSCSLDTRSPYYATAAAPSVSLDTKLLSQGAAATALTTNTTTNGYSQHYPSMMAARQLLRRSSRDSSREERDGPLDRGVDGGIGIGVRRDNPALFPLSQTFGGREIEERVGEEEGREERYRVSSYEASQGRKVSPPNWQPEDLSPSIASTPPISSQSPHMHLSLSRQHSNQLSLDNNNNAASLRMLSQSHYQHHSPPPHTHPSPPSSPRSHSPPPPTSHTPPPPSPPSPSHPHSSPPHQHHQSHLHSQPRHLSTTTSSPPPSHPHHHHHPSLQQTGAVPSSQLEDDQEKEDAPVEDLHNEDFGAEREVSREDCQEHKQSLNSRLSSGVSSPSVSVNEDPSERSLGERRSSMPDVNSIQRRRLQQHLDNSSSSSIPPPRPLHTKTLSLPRSSSVVSMEGQLSSTASGYAATGSASSLDTKSFNGTPNHFLLPSSNHNRTMVEPRFTYPVPLQRLTQQHDFSLSDDIGLADLDVARHHLHHAHYDYNGNVLPRAGEQQQQQQLSFEADHSLDVDGQGTLKAQRTRSGYPPPNSRMVAHINTSGSSSGRHKARHKVDSYSRSRTAGLPAPDPYSHGSRSDRLEAGAAGDSITVDV